MLYAIMNYSNICAKVCTNLFILVSGYYLSQSQFRMKKLFMLWAQVFFYSVVITLVFAVFGISDVRPEDIFKAFLPVSYNRYWFITCYFAMYLCMPILNKLIAAADEREHRRFIAILVLLISIWGDLTPLVSTLQVGGTHFVWFLVLYLVAAYIRKYPERIDRELKHPFALFFGIAFALLLIRIPVQLAVNSKPWLIDYIDPAYFENYSSLPVFVMSACFFIGFSRIKIEKPGMQKMISFFAPLTFGVYLIHDNNLIRGVLWSRWLKTDQFAANWLLPGKCCIVVLLVFAASALMDWLTWQRLKKIVSKIPVERVEEKIREWLS